MHLCPVLSRSPQHFNAVYQMWTLQFLSAGQELRSGNEVTNIGGLSWLFHVSLNLEKPLNPKLQTERANSFVGSAWQA